MSKGADYFRIIGDMHKMIIIESIPSVFNVSFRRQATFPGLTSMTLAGDTEAPTSLAFVCLPLQRTKSPNYIIEIRVQNEAAAAKEQFRRPFGQWQNHRLA